MLHSRLPSRPFFLFFVVLFLSSVLGAGSAWCVSAGLSDTERRAKTAELEQLKKRIESLRDDLNTVKGQHDTARKELRATESRIGKLVQNLRHLRNQLKDQEQRLENLQRDRARLKKEVKQQRTLLADQISAAYVIGRQEYLKLLLNPEDPAVAGRVFTYYRYFNQARSTRIDNAMLGIQELAAVEDSIARETDKLRQLQKQKRRDRSALENTVRARKLVVAQLKTELMTKGAELDRLVENERDLEKLLNAIREMLADIPAEAGEQKSFASLKGRLSWPAMGRVEKLFGKKRGGGRVTWNGVIIHSAEGNNVRAVSRGRVAYADWLRGYGLLVIVDHGDGFMSLYGHNQSLYKETGDWVEAGEVLAAVGNSGGRETAGLYFEIRQNGRPSNPVKWCRQT